MAGETYFPRTSSMSSSRAEPLLPAGRFAPHRREQPGAILGTNFANSACAIACRSMVYRWLRIQVSAVSVYRTRDERNALAAANDRALNGAVYSAALALTPQHVVERKDLRHHWNACSRTSVAGVSDLPSVIHSSAACAV